MNVTAIMESVHMNRGYVGGSYVDELPNLGLTEATGRLPCIILESQLDLLGSVGRRQDTLFETAMQAMSENAENPDMTRYKAINEAAVQDLKSKVEGFFARLIQYVRSIIAKLKANLSSVWKSGQELYAQYGGMLSSDEATYKSLTIEGYLLGKSQSMVDGLSRNLNPYLNDVHKLVTDGMGKLGIPIETPEKLETYMAQMVRFTKGLGATNTTSEDRRVFDEAIATMTRHDAIDRERIFGSVISGSSITERDWIDGFQRRIWGDETTIHYGEDMFTMAGVKGVLTNDAVPKQIEVDYQAFEKSLVRYQNEMTSRIEGLSKKFNQDDDIESFMSDALSRYFNVYLQYASEAMNAVTRILNIKVRYYRERSTQATKMFMKMVNASKGGADTKVATPANESTDDGGDQYDPLEFDLE